MMEYGMLWSDRRARRELAGEGVVLLYEVLQRKQVSH